MENLRLGVSAVRHDMKREETVEEVEKNTELGRQTPKRNVVRSSRAGGATSEQSPLCSGVFLCLRQKDAIRPLPCSSFQN